METPAYKFLEITCGRRPSPTESTRTKPRHTKSKGPCAPKGARASSRVCEGERRARTESGDETGGRDDRLLHDEDLELLHHGHGCRFCSHSSASPSPSSPTAVAGDERRERGRQVSALVRSVDVGPSCLVPRDFHARPIYDRSPVGLIHFVVGLRPILMAVGRAENTMGSRHIRSCRSEYSWRAREYFPGASESTVAAPLSRARLFLGPHARHGHPSPLLSSPTYSLARRA
jgi:hypothetical protein